MGEEITTIDISNAEVLSASSFTNVKNSIDIKIDNLGNLTDANDNAVTMLNFGDRGDHCVTVINAELPSNFSEGYRAYFLVNLKNKTYIQKCLMEGNIAKALITKEISLDSQSTECLFALIEADATTGNLREQQEIFVSDVFMGTVRSNFLDSNWMDADISVSEDLTVLDKFETPNPDKYTSMVWVNGETKLNAANMNNIIKGIDELKEQAVEVNPSETATELLSKIKINDKILASGKTYQYDDIVENGTLKDGIFNEILQLAVLGCSNITIIQSDLLFTFVGLSAAMKNDSTVIGLVFHSNMVVYPTDTEKHSMCVELILFQDNSVSNGGTFNLPEPPIFSDNVQDKKYTLELRKSDSLSEFVPQWTEKSSRALVKNGTYYSKNGGLVFNTISLTDAEITQINNKEIDVISGKFVLTAEGGTTDYCVRFNGSNFISYEYTMDDLETYVDYITYGIMMIEENQAILVRVTTRTAFVPKIPAENNKILITNNGKLKYVDIPGSIEVNPSEEATDTLNKLKIDGTVYNFNKRLEKTGTLISDENGMFVNAIFLTDEEFERVKNGEIDTIYGIYYKDSLTSSPYTCSFSKIIDQGEGELSYVFTNSSSMVENGILSIILFQCTISKSDSKLITIEKEMPVIPLLPTDASGKTLSLISTNGSIGWKDTSVGTQKFENIEVSGTITTGGKSLNTVEANPSDDATATLSKLKVGDTTYDFNRTLIKNGTYVSGEGFATLNSFSFTAEEMEKINNGEIDMLVGEFKTPNETYYYNAKKYYSGDDDMPLFICSSYTLMDGESIHYNEVQIYPSLSQGGMISADSPFIPELPSDASTKKYTLKAVNGTLTWVDLATDTETFNNVIANSNVTAQGNISAVGKISTVGGLEVYGNSVFTKDLSTSATLKGAHVVAGDTELLPVTPNPSDAATASLNKIKIGNVVYNIVGSSSSGGSSGSDSSAGDSSFVAFEYNNIITNGKVNDGVFQELTNLINTHKIPVIIDDQRTYSYSGMATSPDGGKNGLAFVFELHSYDVSSYTYFSGQLPLILWSDNSISEDAMAFGSIPTPPDDQTGTKQYVLSGTAMGLAWIDIDKKISSAITSTLEADY